MSFTNIKIDRKLVVLEHDLASTTCQNKPLKQVDIRQKMLMPNANIQSKKKFASPYAKQNFVAQSTNQRNIQYMTGEAQLEASQDSNISIEGLSAQEVSKMRDELCQTIKPETLAALKSLSAMRKLPKKEKTKEEIMLSKIEAICKESEDSGETEVEEVNTDTKPDLSFLPISPKNKFVNMNKVESDKLQWMQQIEMKSESAKSLSIRFHVDGRVMEPEINVGEEEFVNIESKEFDPYEESLRHHGEEPGREGYTISELFWLSRSSFPQQRHLALMTLMNVIRCSKRLAHAHQFNVTTITQNLVDCGILFLARWLIDDAGLRLNYLEDGLALMHTLIVDNNDTSEQCSLNWPDLRTRSCLPRLMSQSATKADRARQCIPMSERTEIHDDVLMDEDIISCLVLKTHLVTRISWIFFNGNCLSPQIDKMFLGILTRIAAHSLEMANHLCHDHESLLTGLIKSHIDSNSPLCSYLLRLLRIIIHSSPSLAHKITRDKKIITAIYPLIEEASTTIEVKIEAVRLITVLALRGIHLGPIVELTQIITEIFIANLADKTISSFTHSIAMFLVALLNSKAVISPSTFTLIENSVAICHLKITSTNTHDTDFHALTTLVHLCTEFFLYQYRSNQVSSNEACIHFWNVLVCPLLQSTMFHCICQQASSNTVLGYEHFNSNLSLVKLDLTNHLQYSTVLAAQTANPNFIDLKPFFIVFHPSFSLLSALMHVLLSMTDTKMLPSLLPNFENSFSNLINNEYLTKYLTKLSETPFDKIVPSSAPYSAVVQLELETLCQVLLASVGVSQWTQSSLSSTFARIVYKVAVRILPFLGHNLQHLAHKLAHNILFSPTIISAIESNLPVNVKSLFLLQLPSLLQLYQEHIPSFEQAAPLLDSLSPNISIDDFPISTDWIDSPILEMYKITKANHEATVNSKSMMNCLTYVMFLEMANIFSGKDSAIVGLYRISYLLISVDWIDTFSETNNHLVMSSLLAHYLARPQLIDINARINKKLSFYDLYQDLLIKYFFDSLSNIEMTNIVLFPCAMRFPAKYRRHLWSDYFGHLRLLTIDVSQSMLAIEEYLSPDETDNTLIRYYWRALRDGHIMADRNRLLYWICVHHINRFVYDQTTVGGNKDQRGYARVLADTEWQHKPWIKHVRLYKQHTINGPQFYDSVPLKRLQHLQRLYCL